MRTLLIVESYSKCEKIKSFLDNSYKVIASLGHVRELVSLKDIDTENNFNPNYTLISDKKKSKHIENMRNEIVNADEILLATDDDREGESIAWHLCILFGIPVDKTKRIVFHEITENAIKKAIENHRFIDMDVVFSQQSRQILDLLLGHSVTPVLWKHLSENKNKPLSAGRCQTPALKIVYDNFLEKSNEKKKKVYNTTGYFTSNIIPFELNERFESKDEIKCFLEKCIHYEHSYSCSVPVKKTMSPPEPLTTSRLLQLCSVELNISPKEAMKICQNLYEEGYITYIRTDTKKYSSEFVESMKSFIKKEHNELFINKKIDDLIMEFEPKEPHEAIRPTNIMTNIASITVPKEKKVYHLIWCNALESVMAEYEYYSITSRLSCPDGLFFSRNSEMDIFLGWKIIKNKKNSKNYYSYLKTIKDNTMFHSKKISSKVSIENSRSNLTEAKLIEILEVKGIGRPSTYAMLIEKIKERGYVNIEDIKGETIECEDYNLEDNVVNEIKTTREFGNEKNKIVIQDLGLIVIDFLNNHFCELFNYDYTRSLETELDKITSGQRIWHELCREYYTTVKQLCEKMMPSNGSVKHIKKELKEPGQILGRYQDEDLVLKKGKYGLYVNWGDKHKNLSCFGNRPIENISYEDVLKVITLEDKNIIRIIDENIIIKNGKYGDYIYYKTIKMKKPSFIKLNGFNYDYRNCNPDIIKNWVSINK